MLGQFRKWGVNSQDKLLVKSIWVVFHGLLGSWKDIACENTTFQEISFSAFNVEQERLKENYFIKLNSSWWKFIQIALNFCECKKRTLILYRITSSEPEDYKSDYVPLLIEKKSTKQHNTT